VSEPVVLALEGSSRVCSGALLATDESSQWNADEWRVKARCMEVGDRSHAKVLLPILEALLEESGANRGDLRAVVVGTGPGTFTGVRITVATARALSLALSIPVLGVSSLSALVSAAVNKHREALTGIIIPVVDARRDQLFYGVYESTQGSGLESGTTWERSTAYGVCDRRELSPLVEKLADRGGTEGGVHVVLSEDTGPSCSELDLRSPWERVELRAEWLLRGQQSLLEPGQAPGGAMLSGWLREALGPRCSASPATGGPGEVGSPESVKPVYVRSPDADVHITKMRDPWGGSTSGRA
jgi:tRNA threonylcarbamoyl adenosine modification protein YeaZ